MSRKSEYNNYEVENDFEPISIDGKSWAYRDPNNTEKIALDSKGDDNYDGFMNTGSGNRDSYAFTNPLYKFSEGEVNRAARAEGISNVDEPEEVETLLKYLNGGGMAKQEEPEENKDNIPETFKPSETTPANQERLDQTQAAYDENFEGGNIPWQPSSAMESYANSFNAAATAGQDWDVGWYLRQRADDKKAGVANYIGFLQDSNAMMQAENHDTTMRAIEDIARLGIKPPSLNDPKDDFEYYADRIQGIDD